MSFPSPNKDPNQYELGVVRIKNDKLWVVVKDEKKEGSKVWLLVDEEFNVNELTFWDIAQSDFEERTDFLPIPKSFYDYTKNKRESISNPIVIKVSFNTEKVTIYLEDYNKKFEVTEKWSVLAEKDKFTCFKTLYRKLRSKIESETGEETYNLRSRLLSFKDLESDLVDEIIKDWKQIIAVMDWIGYIYSVHIVPENKPEPKFKVGDQVKYKGEASNTMTIKAVKWDEKIQTYYYDLVWDDTKNEISEIEGVIEKTNETPETPKKIIKRGEFFNFEDNPQEIWISTRDNVQSKSAGYDYFNELEFFEATIYSQLGFILFSEKPTTLRKFGELNCAILYDYEKGFTFFCKKGQLDINELNVTDLELAEVYANRIINFLATIEVKLADEYQFIWEKLKKGIERTLINAYWLNKNNNCEADPNDIQSGQVKAFYDLNKARIEKLNKDFSCKIIKALVSLSEYEKCGSPSSATLTKAKTDLLSKISKLKV